MVVIRLSSSMSGDLPLLVRLTSMNPSRVRADMLIREIRGLVHEIGWQKRAWLHEIVTYDQFVL